MSCICQVGSSRTPWWGWVQYRVLARYMRSPWWPQHMACSQEHHSASVMKGKVQHNHINPTCTWLIAQTRWAGKPKNMQTVGTPVHYCNKEWCAALRRYKYPQNYLYHPVQINTSLKKTDLLWNIFIKLWPTSPFYKLLIFWGQKALWQKNRGYEIRDPHPSFMVWFLTKNLFCLLKVARLPKDIN